MKIKWKLYGFLIIILVGAGLFYLIRIKQSAATLAPAQNLNIQTVQKGTIQEKVHGTGVVQAVNDQVLKTSSPQTINQVLVKVGDSVKKGQTLATYQNIDLSNQIDQDKLTIQSDTLSLNSAERDLQQNNHYLTVTSPASGTINEIDCSIGDPVQSNTPLAVIKSGGTTLQIRSKATGTVSNILIQKGDTVSSNQTLITLTGEPSLQDKVNQFNIQLQKDQDKLNADTSSETFPPVVSPFSSMVISVDVQPGDAVDKGTNLFEVANLTSLQMVLPIDELDITKVAIGQSVNVVLNSLPNQIISGKVTAISDVGTVTNGVSTFNVTVALKNPGEIKSGMTGEGDILTVDKHNIVEVPLNAIQLKNNKSFVMLDDGIGKSHLVKVKTGIHDTNFVEITSGLQAGQKIIIPTQTTLTLKQTNKNKKKNKTNSPLTKLFGGGRVGKNK